jgi:mRNA interferase RelE/StbE
VSEDTQQPYTLRTTPTVRRALAETLPGAVAAVACQSITGPLLEQPHPIGKQLLPPLDDRFSARRGTYRVIYRIDDKAHVVTVVDIGHRRDIYRALHALTHQQRRSCSTRIPGVPGQTSRCSVNPGLTRGGPWN